MDVLIINSYEKINERLKNEIRTLSDAGHDVDIVLWQRGELNQPQRTEEEQARLDIDYIRLDAPFGSWVFLFYLPLFYLKLTWYVLGRDDDALHCCHMALLPFTAMLGRLTGRAVVYDAFEYHAVSFHKSLPDSISQYLKCEYIEAVENVFVAMCTGVVTIDSADDELVSRYRDHNPNTRVLFNAVSLRDLPGENAGETVVDEYEDRKLVTYVGGIKRIKGILETLEAADHVRDTHPDVTFLFIGTFTDDSEPEAKELIERNDLAGVVEFEAWMPYDEMLEYLAVSEVGLAPFRPTRKFQLLGMGTNRKIFTYMSAGLPVVAPDFLAVSEHVREHECGLLVDTTDPAALGGAIERLLDDPANAREMGERGRATIESDYNWETESEKLLAVYEAATA